MSFDKTGLRPELLAQIQSLGFKQPTPIQAQAIPLVLAGKDVLAGAQTGTGKTAAFGFPLIQKLSQSPASAITDKPIVRSLILTPTRELAQQVFDSLNRFNQKTGLNIVVAYGGTSLNVQRNKLRQGADVLVATPGRLLDHAHKQTIQLDQVEHLVLDEADRMLDMGFMPDIKRLLRLLPTQHQTLLFSATFSDAIKRLAYQIMDKPVEVQVTPGNSTASTVHQIVYPVDKVRKRELLSYLIGSRNWQQVLIFTRTKQGSDALAHELKLDGIEAASINGDKSQGARQRALDQFKTGKIRALIATDVAARGLDIHQLEHVVNFDMPFKAEDYIHRIGRTGRAGKSGHAISLMSQDEESLLIAIERLLDQRLGQEWLAGYEPSPIQELQDTAQPRKKTGANAERRKLKEQMLRDAGLLPKKKKRRR